MLVLNKTPLFMRACACSQSRVSTDRSRAPFLTLSFSLPLCGFYNQIRIDVSPRDTKASARASTRASAWITFGRIYVLRLMWAVGGDDKCSPDAPTAPPQPDFVNRLTHPGFFLLRWFERPLNAQLTAKLDKRHPETTRVIRFRAPPSGSFLNINIVSAVLLRKLSASYCVIVPQLKQITAVREI